MFWHQKLTQSAYLRLPEMFLKFVGEPKLTEIYNFEKKIEHFKKVCKFSRNRFFAKKWRKCHNNEPK